MSARLRIRPAAFALLAGLALASSSALAQSMTITAVVVSKANCHFNNTNLTLDFSAINPASTADATASVSGSVSCTGGKTDTTVGFTVGTGIFASGGTRRMRHATVPTEFLPYSVSISPAGATIPKNSSLNFTLSGTITASQFQNVMAGSYLDLVVVTVLP